MAANVFPQVKSETLFPCPLESPPPLPGVGKCLGVFTEVAMVPRVDSITTFRSSEIGFVVTVLAASASRGAFSNCFTTIARMEGLVPRVKWPCRVKGTQIGFDRTERGRNAWIPSADTDRDRLLLLASRRREWIDWSFNLSGE